MITALSGDRPCPPIRRRVITMTPRPERARPPAVMLVLLALTAAILVLSQLLMAPGLLAGLVQSCTPLVCQFVALFLLARAGRHCGPADRDRAERDDERDS